MQTCGHGDMETWRHGKKNFETWRHGEMKTLRHRDLEMRKRKDGRHEDMET